MNIYHIVKFININELLLLTNKMVSLNEKQIEEIKQRGNIDIIQDSFKGEMSKYLFKTKLDKINFEIKNLNIINKELRIERDMAKHRIKSIVNIRRDIANRIEELRKEKRNV